MAQRPVCRVHAAQDVLEEGVVGAALGRRAQEVAPPGVALPGVPVPLLDGVGRIGQHHVEGGQAVAVGEGGALQRVAAGDGEVLHAVQHQVHAGDGGGHVVALLAVEAQGAVLAAAALDLVQGGDQHAAGAAGGVVDALAGLGCEHLHHQMHHGAVGVELLGRVAAVVGELLDQELVAVAQLVLGHVGQRERLAGEVLQQVLERGVGQALLVGPGRVAEDAVQPVGVGGLDGAHGVLDGAAHVAWASRARRSSARLRG